MVGNKYFCHVLSKIAAATVDTLVCLLLIVRDSEIIWFNMLLSQIWRKYTTCLYEMLNYPSIQIYFCVNSGICETVPIGKAFCILSNSNTFYPRWLKCCIYFEIPINNYPISVKSIFPFPSNIYNILLLTIEHNIDRYH